MPNSNDKNTTQTLPRLLKAECYKLTSLKFERNMLAAIFAAMTLINYKITTSMLDIGMGEAMTENANQGMPGLMASSVFFTLIFALFAAAQVSREYKHGAINTTVICTQNRPKIFLAKILTGALISGTLTLISGTLTLLLFTLTNDLPNLSTTTLLSNIWGPTLGATLISIFAVGLAFLLRTPGITFVSIALLYFLAGPIFLLIGTIFTKISNKLDIVTMAFRPRYDLLMNIYELLAPLNIANPTHVWGTLITWVAVALIAGGARFILTDVS